MVVLGTIWKSLIAGIVYILAGLIGGMALMAMQLKMPEATVDMKQMLISFFVSGALLAAMMGPLARSLKLTMRKSVMVIFGVLFLNAASVVIEAAFFVNGIIPKDTLPAVLLQQFIVSLLAALAIAGLFCRRLKSGTSIICKGSFFQWTWRLAASAMSYVVFYYIFGNINYRLITGVFYKANMGGLSVPTAMETLSVEPFRGLMLVLSVLPLILVADGSWKEKAVLAGGVLFVAGGLVPLISQINVLPTVVIVASLFEIFFQNFLTGAVTAYLFSPQQTESRGLYF